MDLVGSIVKAQGHDFAVVQVHGYMVQSAQEAEETIRAYGGLFPGMPVVLMAVSGSTGTTYWGRPDLANYMAQTPPGMITWQRFSFN